MRFSGEWAAVGVGTWVNAGAILLGGMLGLAVRREPSAGVQRLLKAILAVAAIGTGVRCAWGSLHGSMGHMVLQVAAALLALVLGNLLGKVLGLQRQLNHLGRYAKERFSRARGFGRPEPGDGFIIGSILFCAGPLSIFGAVQEGLMDDPRIMLLKAAMDGLAIMALVRVLGAGTMLSALPVVVYQGAWTLASRAMRPVLSHGGVMEGWNVVAGLLLVLLPLIILDVRKVPLADYLPALVLGAVLGLWVG